MPRARRIQTPGLSHVTTRGNNGVPIYHDDDDRGLFVVLLHRTAAILDWRVHLRCLMTNHFHLLVETKAENLAQGMHRIHSRYAHAANERHRRTGHVFERRYASRVIESEIQLKNTALYRGAGGSGHDQCLALVMAGRAAASAWHWTGPGEPRLSRLP